MVPLEDLDQHFSRLTAYIRHHLREAETLCDFQTCMTAFSARAYRPHEKNYYVKRVDQVRSWKEHLACMKRHLRGIGGASAPKVFQFTKVRRATVLNCSIIILTYEIKFYRFCYLACVCVAQSMFQSFKKSSNYHVQPGHPAATAKDCQHPAA